MQHCRKLADDGWYVNAHYPITRSLAPVCSIVSVNRGAAGNDSNSASNSKYRHGNVAQLAKTSAAANKNSSRYLASKEQPAKRSENGGHGHHNDHPRIFICWRRMVVA